MKRSHFRLVNDKNGDGEQGPDIPVVVSHRSLDLNSISCSLELLCLAHNYGECCVCRVDVLAVKGRVSTRGTRFSVLVLLGGMYPRA